MHLWQIESSPEVDAFLIDNAGLVDELVESIESLTITEGLPDIGAMEVEPSLFYWLTADHIVVYRRLPKTQSVRLISIKPDN
ncbi:MAG: hypothetical protein KDD78_14345 [Caldilineaceae bacterium]|nr:hypothetical protein [Caldilineaceae bacterium]